MVFILLLLCLLNFTANAQSQDWSTYGTNAQRTGLNPSETTITSAKWATLTRAWSFRTSGGVLGQPVVALNYDISNVNVVYGRRLNEIS
jgi:hypothetical protein